MLKHFIKCFNIVNGRVRGEWREEVEKFISVRKKKKLYFSLLKIYIFTTVYASIIQINIIMTSLTFFFLFIPILALILLGLNILLSPHNPYQEKNSAFECGFHSFLGQNRTQFSISFFIFALLFLLFDLEILLVYPYVVSAYTNGIYGLIIMLVFFFILTLGFVFELGKNALKIDSRQGSNIQLKNWKQLVYINS